MVKKSTSGEVLKKCFPLIVATQSLPSWYEKIEKTPFTKVFSHDGNNYIQIVQLLYYSTLWSGWQ